MEFAVHLPGLYELGFATSIGLGRGTSTGRREIPPERIGLDGNYDHAGLSKRVGQLVEVEFSSIADRLQVSQRGQVVVLLAKPTIVETIIFNLVDRILQLEGADSVEINGVRHLHPSLIAH